jgi:hypothetical protein
MVRISNPDTAPALQQEIIRHRMPAFGPAGRYPDRCYLNVALTRGLAV